MFFALDELLSRSLSPSLQQLPKEFIEIRKIVLVPLDPKYLNNAMDFVQKIVAIVAHESVSDCINLLIKLSENSITCVQTAKGTMASYIKRFLLQDKTYLNPTNAGRILAESQNLEMTLQLNSTLK